MSESAFIVGIGMTKFGKHPSLDTEDLGVEAVLGALADADMRMSDVEILTAGNIMGGVGIGQRLQKQLGQRGIPVFNVENACATGATALRTLILAIKAGEADVGLAIGVEKLAGVGLLSRGGVHPSESHPSWSPSGRQGAVTDVDGLIGTESMPGTFAQVGIEYLAQHGYTGDPLELFARISVKNHKHSTLNPLAAYTKELTLEQVMGDLMIAYPNTRSMCSANCDGAAALLVVSSTTFRSLSLRQRSRAVKVTASVLTSDAWQDGCQALWDVNCLTRAAARQAYEAAGIGPEDLDMVELHDCFATAELVHYDNLELCEPGGAVDFFNSGAPWRDGKTPVNVSGGLESKGHPISATGLANIWEICHHLRGEAGDRQVAGARVGLAHVLGLGSSCGVHILEKTSVA